MDDFGDSYFGGDDFAPPAEPTGIADILPWADAPTSTTSTTPVTSTTTTTTLPPPVAPTSTSTSTTTTSTSNAPPAFNFNAQPPTFTSTTTTSFNAPPAFTSTTTTSTTPSYVAAPISNAISATTTSTAPPTFTTTSSYTPPAFPTTNTTSTTASPSYNATPSYTTTLAAPTSTTTTQTISTTTSSAIPLQSSPKPTYQGEIPTHYSGLTAVPPTLVAATYNVLAPNYNNNVQSDPMAPPDFGDLPPIYSSPSHTSFQANALYQAIEASSGVFFRTGFPSPPVLNQDVASLYPLAPYEDPDEIDFIEYGVRKARPTPGQRKPAPKAKGGKKKKKRKVNPKDSAASGPSHDFDSFLLDDDAGERSNLDGEKDDNVQQDVDIDINELTSDDTILGPQIDSPSDSYLPPTLSISGGSSINYSHQSSSSSSSSSSGSGGSEKPNSFTAKTRQQLYPHRESISRSFSPTLNYSLLYSSNSQYIMAQLPLVFLSIAAISLTLAIIVQNAAAISIGTTIIVLILLSLPTVWRTWKPSFFAWRRYKGQEFHFFPGSSIQHAVPFDPILCVQFCCPSRKHSLTELAQRIHQLDQAKPILLFAVSCYPTLDSYNNANRFHVEHIPLKDLAKSKLLQYRSHMYYVGVDSFANVSVPPEEILKCQHLSSAPTYLRKEYQKRPLGASYIELNATYSLSSDDYAWLQQCRDKLIETHSNQRYPYVDVDVLYLLDGVSPSTTDYNFFRDVENLSVVPLDLLPTALNQFSKYNTNGCNNPRGLSSFAADSVEDMDYELSMAGRAPMNTFLPIPIQLIEQYNVDEYDQRRVKLFNEWIDSQTRQAMIQYDDIDVSPPAEEKAEVDPTLPDEGEHWTTKLTSAKKESDSDDSETEDTHVEGKIDVAREIAKIEAKHLKVRELLKLHPECDPETILYHRDMESDGEDNGRDGKRDHKKGQFGVSGSKGYGSTGGSGTSSSSSQTNVKPTINDYDTILAAIEPDLYRTSCKLSHPIHTQGIHYSQLIYNQFTFILAVALGLMSVFSICWRGPCCSPRKYAFYHKKVLKLSQVYSLPDNEGYLSR